MRDQSCPCGSGNPLDDCCGRYHSGEVAPTAEALMRSRYSAYGLKNSAYLRDTWHPSTCPAELNISNDDTPWQRLVIITTEKGGAGEMDGVVEFAAFYQGGQLHERSRFLREGERWYYLDGELLPPHTIDKAGRNAPCPCGSGRKFKRCCG
ncbi:MAG: YchJ family protein [Pseudomonadota bacterium]